MKTDLLSFHGASELKEKYEGSLAHNASAVLKYYAEMLECIDVL